MICDIRIIKGIINQITTLLLKTNTLRALYKKNNESIKQIQELLKLRSMSDYENLHKTNCGKICHRYQWSDRSENDKKLSENDSKGEDNTNGVKKLQ